MKIQLNIKIEIILVLTELNCLIRFDFQFSSNYFNRMNKNTCVAENWIWKVDKSV